MLTVKFLILSVVDCGTLTNPANGQVNHTAGTIFGRTATYSCNTGYNLVGDNTCTCEATGAWPGSVPTCQGVLLLKFSYQLCSEQMCTRRISHNQVNKFNLANTYLQNTG